MKIVAGVLIAGGLATVAALFGTTSGSRLGAAAGGSKGLTQEHYAWATQPAYLDGPRREAWGSNGGSLDEDFNCYVAGRNLGRCIRASDDLVVRYFGNDYATLDFGGDEGPADFLPRLSPISGTGYGQGIGGLVVIGLPWKGGVENCVYAYSDSGIWRIWKNQEKDGRWWFKRLVGGGKLAIPGGRIYQGQTWRKPGEKEYKAVFFTSTGFYVLEDGAAGAKFSVLLALAGIRDQFPPARNRPARPTLGQVDSGGYYYLGYYFGDGYAWKKLPKIQRVSPDGKKVEPWVTHSGARKGTGGPGMKTGWHCGPHFHPPKAVSPWYPPGILLCHAHDEHIVRRVTPDGRVSTLYEDGEWREPTGYGGKQLMGVAGFVYGANGWALTSSSGEGFSKRRGEGLCLIKGIDLGKPSVEKLDK